MTELNRSVRELSAAGELNLMGLDNADFVGIAYNVVTDTWRRLGAVEGWPVGAFPGAQISPVFQRLRRVALRDDGTLFKGISWLDFTKYEDGMSVDLTGGDGQIMVEYLPAYWRADVLGDWLRVMISHLPLDGFVLHPLFRGGVQAVYSGAYEGSVVAGSGLMSSIARDPSDGISPVWPVTTRAGAWGYGPLSAQAGDVLCEARGAGWQQWDYLTMHWQWMLAVVGFAGWNFQSMVGNGRASLSDGDWLNDVYIGRCGLGDAASGYHGSISNGGSAGHLTDVSQLLGVENFWGNIWKRNVALFSDNEVYYKPLPPYDYGSIASWTRLLDAAGEGVTLPAVSGYGGLPFSGLGFGLPQDVTGSSSTRMSDYFYANTAGVGLRVPLVGAYAISGTLAGPSCVIANYSAASATANIGGRLCFKKKLAA